MDSIDAKPQRNESPKAYLDGLPADAAAAGAGLPLAIAAWVLVDPAVAARLVEAWLATADGAGDLTPACPVIGQLAERVAGALPPEDPFLERILPALARCVEREFDRYDVRGTGLPLWPSAEEALFPAEHAPGRFTVDLAVLLSNEAGALARLVAGHAELDRFLGAAEGEQRELDDWLAATFWNEEASLFDRHDDGQASVPDRSPCGFFPLVWEGRTDEMVEGLPPRTAEWDAAAWSARGWVLFFALLLPTPHNSVVARMRRAGLPAGATAVEAAAWAVLAAGAEGARTGFTGDMPRSARWLDAHGRQIARGALVGGAVLLAGLLTWAFVHRESLGADSGDELERRARVACAEGKHDRAAALYGQAGRRGHGLYFQYRQAGEWMHLEQHADAEAAYRAILAREPATPNARMNLALAVLKQGRREEARDLYRAIAEEGAAMPELAARARLAAELIDRQLALDRSGGAE